MALLEVTLEKPALVEEYQQSGTAPVRSGTTAESESNSESSGGGKGKLVGLLAVLGGVGLLAWKLKARGSDTEQSEFGETESEHGPEPDIGADESGGAKRKVAGILGLVVAIASLAAARKRRG